MNAEATDQQSVTPLAYRPPDSESPSQAGTYININVSNRSLGRIKCNRERRELIQNRINLCV